MRNHSLVLLTSAMVPILAGGPASAQGVPAGSQPESANGPHAEALDNGQADANTGSDRLSVSLYTDVTNSYFWRGIRQADDEFIVQPGLEVSAGIFANERYTVSAVAGVWSSFQDSNGAPGDGITANHYERDYYAGVAVASGRLTFAGMYQTYTSPNDSFVQVDEVRVDVSYDDVDLIAEGFSLNPSASLAFELSGAASGSDEGIFLGLSVAPVVLESPTPLGELSLEIPVGVGLGVADYYQDAQNDSEIFGYLDVGADASFDIPSPPGFGSWSWSVGVHALFLGDAASDINRGTDTELTVSAGFAIDF